MIGIFKNIKPSQECEWGKAKIALIHEPGIETIFGVLNPHSSNFLKAFSIGKAVEEHRRYREEIKKNGIKVYDVIELLAEDRSLVKSYRELRSYISEIVEIRFEDEIDKKDREKILNNIREYIDTADREELINLLLLKPILHISYNTDFLDETTRFDTRYEIDPVHNLLYMRDPMITTQRGITIGQYRLQIRRRENDIVEFILKYSGIEPVYRIRKGFLEGGDFLPAKEFVLQGVGLLSNMDGCMEAVENRIYGDVEVGLVVDPTPQMIEMHLDGYLGVLSNDLAIISSTRLHTSKEPDVFIYRYFNNREEIKCTGKVKLSTYLKEWGFDLIEVPLEEHMNLAENFLLLEKMKLIGVSRIGKEFREKLEELGVKATYIEMDNLLKGYGGPHCLTQVILRNGC